MLISCVCCFVVIVYKLLGSVSQTCKTPLMLLIYILYIANLHSVKYIIYILLKKSSVKSPVLSSRLCPPLKPGCDRIYFVDSVLQSRGLRCFLQTEAYCPSSSANIVKLMAFKRFTDTCGTCWAGIGWLFHRLLIFRSGDLCFMNFVL